MKDSKNLVIGMLCAVVCIMAVAFAAFQTQLNVNGTASIESSWDVHIKDITCTATPATGAAADSVSAEGEKLTDTTATFTIKFNQPGDTASCIVTYENTGSLDATLTHTVTGAEGTDAIKFVMTGTDAAQSLVKTTGTAQVSFTASYEDVKDESGNSTTPTGTTATLTIASTAVQAGLSS